MGILSRTATIALLAGSSIAVRGADDEPTHQVEEEIDVLSLTPVSGTGIDPERFPWGTHQVDRAGVEAGAPVGVTEILERTVPGIHTSSVQNSPLQNDLLFRGFSTSPLLGSSQGLSIWEDGIRVNEIFGDIVQWDLLPLLALDRIELLAGAHAAFGPNTLGGALALHTKSGRSSSRGRLRVSVGSWDRRHVGAESGATWGPWAAYGAGEIFEEEGWRDFSPSESKRLFAKLSYQRGPTGWDFGIGRAGSRLIGNGTAPEELLQIDRSQVFTHPDETDNDLFFPRLRWQRSIGGQTLIETVAYYRRSDIATFNADARELDDDENETSPLREARELLDDEPDAEDNRSFTGQRGHGASFQITLSQDVGGSRNLLGLGASWDEGDAEFRSSTELAFLTQDRSTVATGIFDPESFVGVDSSLRRSAVFATDSLEASKRVTVTAQARYDSTAIRLRDRIGSELNGEHGYGRLNGGFGAALSLRPHAAYPLTGFAGVSRSSRTPTPVELTCADPEDPCRLPNAFVADPPLDEVVTTGLEVGLRGRWRSGSWTTSYFDSTSNDDILFVSSGRLTNSGHFTNVASTHRRGIDASVRARFGLHSWFVSYGLVDATFGSTLVLPSVNHPLAVDGEIVAKDGDPIPGIPRHIGKAGLSLRFGPWSTTLATTAQSSRSLRGDEANLLTPVSGFFRAEAELSWTGSRLRIEIAVDNLFDGSYETFGVLGDPQEVLGDSFSSRRFLSPAPPRSVRLSLEFTPFDR